MRICLVQSQFLKGDIQSNIEIHLDFINKAIELKAELIIFPELSITNYEPDLAKRLAVHTDDSRLQPLQDLSDQSDVLIGVGLPTIAKDGVNISILIFQAHKSRTVYTKGLLHEDEYPYFVCGTEQPIIRFKGKRLAFGIYYETLQRKHFLNALEKGADLYIASVAKPKLGVEKAYAHFAALAKDYEKHILMSNAVGPCDDFVSMGCSAVWGTNGKLLGALDHQSAGFLIFDLDSVSVEKYVYSPRL